MPYRLGTNVLTVYATVIYKVDTGLLANLYGMWIAFFRCADSIEQGRKLENLSWRLWQRETFVVDKEDKTAPTTQTLTRNIPSESPSPATSIAASEGSRQPSTQSLPRTTVVRDFSLSQIPTPRTISGAAQSSDAVPEPKSPPAAKVVHSKKPPRFALGSSCSVSEQDQSPSNSKPSILITKKPMLQIGGSSEEDGSLKSALASSRPGSLLSARKKKASLSNNVKPRTIDDEAAVDSDTDDYIDESAIDDDDESSDWEDEENGKTSMDDKFFQRVDSKPNLTSRRSLITLMLAQNDRARTLGDHASQSTSAIPQSRMAHGPSLGA
ncbi:hypothetical protein AU210_016341 [Fusarium oxysporum f. sp. radicis-cucumerinum]|uniref:Uncharacterized protein n=1 Tax=Fusarium oxysporum f. sp. radicis-cucumerinum TaxID=327505 RepID=A0A2H3FNN1_FUSOX|nr:hypothetical protein AU210_016273 [Fusarium oxysporum f. sp. radicis-cucumerinum]PCD21376.1 hypothetical protein AU210_016341 [Fusarium oxysporum f. sp. radicis-cucumerinum]